MGTPNKYHINQLRDYSSLFTRSEVYSWLKMDFASINLKIKRYDDKWLKRSNSSYLDYLKYIYSVIAANYQNEYIFKNEFLNNWLIKELGETNSRLFSEFKVGNSIADLAMFNGISKIFEIKTELDSDARLSLQLENYKKVFNQIVLIIPKSKLKYYEKQESSIGIITYESNNNDNIFSIHRNAIENLDIDPPSIMAILHTEEYKSIVKNFYGNLPKITSFNQYKICSELIFKIPIKCLNQLFIAEMKNRDTSDALSTGHYKEFNQLFLALRMNRELKSKMIDSLKTAIQI
jgi:hypothetical protein